MIADRQTALNAALARLWVQYGSDAVRKASAGAATGAHLTTAAPELDGILGGGVPCGRITELIGPATCGKATLAGRLIGGVPCPEAPGHEDRALAAWLDLPRTCDPDYLRHCGVDLSRLLVVRPPAAADALAIARYLIESETLRVLVVDAGRELAEADAGLVAGGLEHLAMRVTGTRTAVVFLVEPSIACRTLAHVATVRLALRRVRWLMRGADVCGYESQIEVLKSRLGPAGAVVTWRVELNGDGM